MISGVILVAEVGFERPTRKYSRLGALDGARFRVSLFSPLSRSLYPPPAAVALQAHSLPRRLRRAKVVYSSDLAVAKKQRTPIGVLCFLVAEVGFEPHDLRVMRGQS